MANVEMTIEVCPEFDMQDGTTEYLEEEILAVLLANEQVILNEFWWREDAPEDMRKMCSLAALCNDVFMWGCADAEPFFFRDLHEMWEHYKKDPDWGIAVWCIKRRKMMPQKPVYDYIKAAGIWDLDAMDLEKNPSWG
jgi:hypothetical protein